MRSPTTRCSTGCSASTPSTVSVGEPPPSMRAPMPLRKSTRSTISGSRAAFSMTVVPSATTAAMSRFSVAPTLGKSSVTCARVQAVRRGDRIDEAVAGADLDAELGQPADVHVDLARADVAPARHRDARLPVTRHERAEHGDRRAHLRDHLVGRLEAGQVRRVDGERVVGARRRRRRGPRAPRDMTSTSAMSGTFVMRETPGASSAAAMSLSAEFFAPSTRTSPDRGRPPRTMMDSMRDRIPYCLARGSPGVMRYVTLGRCVGGGPALSRARPRWCHVVRSG